MFWAIQAGVAGAKAYLGASASKAQSKAAERIEGQKATSANRVRAAENAMSAARANLGRFTQSVNNQRQLEAMGSAVEANLINARREDDAMVRGSFSAAIADAETKGNMAAAAAFTGVDGGVVDAVNSATALRQSRAAREATLYRDFSNFDAARRASSIVQQGIRGMDSQLIFTDLDTNIDVGRKYAHASPLRDAFFAAAGSIVQSAAAGAFDGPAKAPTTKFSWGDVAGKLGEKSTGYFDSSIKLGSSTGSSFWGGQTRLGGS